MALQLPKINLADAKTRVLLIFGGLLGFILIVYLMMTLLSNPRSGSGASKVAGAPGGLQSVPGGELTPEYYRALVQANTQAAKQAQISGGSAVPTLLNEPDAQANFGSSPSCSIVCPSDADANVQNDIDELVKSGKLSAEEGKRLSDMAKQNVAVNEYAAHLDTLVKQGKISPEQARKLLETYKKQHENTLAKESGKVMDDLIKSGKLSIDSANELLEMQKNRATPDQYAAKLKQMVDEGRISPETANQLLAQYTQQHAREAAAEAIGKLAQMAASGQISPDVARELADYQKRHVSPKEYEEELQHLVRQGKLKPEQAEQLLAQYKQLVPPDVADRMAELQRKNVSIDEYQAELQRQVAAGKLTPEQAQRMLEQYRQVQAPGARAGTMDDIVKQAEDLNANAVRQLAASGKISPETADKLLSLQRAGVPVEEYRRQAEELVRQGKISPEDAQKLIIDYAQRQGEGKSNEEMVRQLAESGRISPDTAEKLLSLQKANVPVEEYRRQIEEMVRQGKISPEDAQKLIASYLKQKDGGVQDLLTAGKISREVAEELTSLQRANVPVDEYKRHLDELVRQGKISSEDAQKLMTNYLKQKDGGVQDLLSTGKITRAVAEELTSLQRAGVPVEEYKKHLDELVRQGKISSEDAQKLLSNYTQMRGGGVQDLLAAGKISPDTAQRLLNLQRANVPVEEYKRQLEQLVREGKITSEDASRLLTNYQQLKGAGALVQQLAGGKVAPEVEQQLLKAQQDNVPVAEYKRQLDELVKSGKITPEQAQQLLDKYKNLHAVRDQADRLAALRAKKASSEEYERELQRGVAAGIITPEQAAKLLEEYKASQAPAKVELPTVNGPGTNEFAQLQKRVQAAAPVAAAPSAPAPAAQPNAQFSAAAAKAKAAAEQQEQQRIQALMSAMSQQAGQLVSSWQPPTMSGQVGAAAKDDGQQKLTAAASNNKSSSGSSSDSAGGPPLIKAGTILYAVLDTAVNSDYPDSPVMATIIDGKYKGAKLLGKLSLAQGQDKVSLSFKLMNMEDWDSGKTVNAFAIDPDTARTVLASNVNYHYFARYGALFASSFISGYANAIKSSGGTTTTGIFGTSTVNPALSPAAKITAGLGQVGTTLGTAVQSYVSTPPTVKIDPGVSLGILFMSDVTG